MVRKTRGRQKIEMARMSKESNLLVTFSKRRPGLFKKASELCILCGAEIALIVFSPGKKVFSFGHPSVESIVERYLAPPLPPSAATPPSTSAALQLVEAHRSANVRELNVQLNEVIGLLEEEKRRGEELSLLRKEGQGGGGRWWEAPIKDLGVAELERLKEAMEDLRKNVSWQTERLMNLAAAAAGGSFAAPYVGVAPQGGGDGGLVVDAKIPAADLGQLFVTPHGYTLGFGPPFSKCLQFILFSRKIN